MSEQEQDVQEIQPEQSPVEQARETFALPSDWTDNQVTQWLKTMENEQEATTEDGVFRFDPTRAQRKPADWDTSELRAYLNGELIGVSNKRRSELVNEYRRRESLEDAWSDQQVLDYFQKGITPEQTSYGAWVYDRTRPQRQAQDWSTEELMSWAEGELKAVGKTTDIKLAIELKKRLSLNVEADTVEAVMKAYKAAQEAEATQAEPTPADENEGLLERAESTSTYNGALTEMNLSFIEGVLDRYVAAVAPGKQITEAEGGKAQRDLDNLFNYVMRLEGPALPEALDMIKRRVVKEREGVFSPSYAYRFTHLLKGDRKAQQRHVNLIELFLIITDRNAGAKRKQIDIRHMLSGYSPAVSDRLTDYFKNYA